MEMFIILYDYIDLVKFSYQNLKKLFLYIPNVLSMRAYIFKYHFSYTEELNNTLFVK